MLLKDKIAVIAGDAFGVGQATALVFMREGARAVLIDDQAGGPDAQSLRIGSQDVAFVHADVTDSAQVQLAARRCGEKLDKVDILFNVAGRDPIRESFENTSEQSWNTMLGRNLNSCFFCAKYFLPLMKRAGSGAIINHASIDAILGNPGIAAYSAAKGGVLPLTHVMARDLAKYRIRVNSISTGAVREGGLPASRRDEARMVVTPAGRLGTPEEVANVALFLASEMSSYVNGANIVVDGGRTATTHGCFDD
jgi:NAD(P)-dependent dehydrogenase (short-subunit alcohol dehydrogenase family)